MVLADSAKEMGEKTRRLVLLGRKPRGRRKPAPSSYLGWACSRQIVQFSKESQRASLCDPITRVGIAFFNFGGLVGRRGCEGRQPDLHMDLQHPNLILTLPSKGEPPCEGVPMVYW